VGSDGRDGDLTDAERAALNLPQFGIAAQGRDLYLTVQSTTSMYSVYLCNINNYEDVARKLHKAIMDAGVAARRGSRPLHVAGEQEVQDYVRKPQGRKPDRKG